MTATKSRVHNGMVADLRERYGISEDAVLTVEAGNDGIDLRPTRWPEPETLTPEQIAEFLLNNAVDDEDYRAALEEVRKLGLDPATIPHAHPSASTS